ncbi:hypothetical protein D3C86_1434280 [compost metagenome]
MAVPKRCFILSAKEWTLFKEERSSGMISVPLGTIRPLPRAPTYIFVSGSFAKCSKASAPIPEVAPVITIIIVDQIFVRYKVASNIRNKLC